jgi:hypothetical protein
MNLLLNIIFEFFIEFVLQIVGEGFVELALQRFSGAAWVHKNF